MERLPFWRVIVAVGMSGYLASPAITSATSTITSPPAVLISELQTASSSSSSEEFVELYNASSTDVAFAGWTIEYKAATSADSPSNWTKRATLAGYIKTHGYYLVAAKSYLAMADADWSATLAGLAGVIRVKDGTGAVVDLLGYGPTANVFEGAAAAAPPAGQSLERLPGHSDEVGGNGINTNNNALDFLVRLLPQPQSSASGLEPLETGGIGSEPATPPTTEPSDMAPSLAPPVITELFPNPASPLSDEQDEFIELYNPNSSVLAIGGYTLQSGSNFHDSYVLPPGTVIGPRSYLELYSTQTKLSLVNSGGAARLLDQHGALVDQSGSYGSAPDGQSWSFGDGGWAWTIDVTPGRENILVLPVAAATSAAKTSTKTATKAKAASKTSNPKTKASSNTKAASKPKTASKTTTTKGDGEPIGAATWLIIAVVALTIGYAIYEYRQDIERIYHKLRGHQGNRAKPGQINGGE